VKEIKIHSDTITLSQFIKWTGEVETGGEANELIRSGQVKVNGEVRLERGKKLRRGDVIDIAGIGLFKII
jgi:ribosome-associated protein